MRRKSAVTSCTDPKHYPYAVRDNHPGKPEPQARRARATTRVDEPDYDARRDDPAGEPDWDGFEYSTRLIFGNTSHRIQPRREASLRRGWI